MNKEKSNEQWEKTTHKESLEKREKRTEKESQWWQSCLDEEQYLSTSVRVGSLNGSAEWGMGPSGLYRRSTQYSLFPKVINEREFF